MSNVIEKLIAESTDGLVKVTDVEAYGGDRRALKAYVNNNKLMRDRMKHHFYYSFSRGDVAIIFFIFSAIHNLVLSVIIITSLIFTKMRLCKKIYHFYTYVSGLAQDLPLF